MTTRRGGIFTELLSAIFLLVLLAIGGCVGLMVWVWPSESDLVAARGRASETSNDRGTTRNLAYPEPDSERTDELWEFIIDSNAVEEIGFTVGPYILIRDRWHALDHDLRLAVAMAALEWAQRKYELKRSDNILLIKQQLPGQTIPDNIGSYTPSLGLSQ